MMRFFTRLRNQRVNRLVNPSSKTEQKDQPVLKLFNTNIAENAAGGLMATGVLALISYFTGAGSREDEIERLKDELLIAKKKQSSTEQKLERNERKLERNEQKLERNEQKLAHTKHELGSAKADIDELSMLLRNTNQQFFLSLQQQQTLSLLFNQSIRQQEACENAFKGSFCFYRQTYAQTEKRRIVANESNHTPGGPSC